MKKERWEIDRSQGCGGFLNPPTHPAHTISVVSYHGKELTSLMSLSLCREHTWIPRSIRDEAISILDGWKAPPIDSPEIQEWISQVLGYFQNCYRNPGVAPENQWAANQVLIQRERKPLEHVEEHAGVRFVRRWYPDYQPTQTAFANARWGK